MNSANSNKQRPMHRAARFWQWTTQRRPDQVKFSAPWWKDTAIKISVYAATGSTSLYCVRPLLTKAGVEGNWTDGPWSYRITSLFVVSPVYSILMLGFGTLAGRHIFFASMTRKIWGRFGVARQPASSRLICEPARARFSKLAEESAVLATKKA